MRALLVVNPRATTTSTRSICFCPVGSCRANLSLYLASRAKYVPSPQIAPVTVPERNGLKPETMSLMIGSTAAVPWKSSRRIVPGSNSAPCLAAIPLA